MSPIYTKNVVEKKLNIPTNAKSIFQNKAAQITPKRLKRSSYDKKKC